MQTKRDRKCPDCGRKFEKTVSSTNICPHCKCSILGKEFNATKIDKCNNC